MADRTPETKPGDARRWLRSVASRTVLSQVPGAVIVTDLEGEVILWSRGAEELFGFEAEEMTGRPIERLYPGLSSADFEERLETIAAGTSFAAEWLGRRKDEGEVWVELRARALRDEDDRMLGCAWVAIDVTARREAEERYRLATLAASEAIWDWDVARGRITWTEGIARVFGWPLEEVGDDPGWWEERIHPDDRERVQRRIREAREAREEQVVGEYRFRRRDGSYADVQDRCALVWEDGLRRVVGAMRDVTERVKTGRVRGFLSEVAGVLGAGLDYERQLRELTRRAVPALADLAFLDLKSDGRFRRVAFEHEGDLEIAAPQEPIRYEPVQDHYATGIAASTSEVVIQPDLDPERVAETVAEVESEDQGEAVRRLGPRSAVSLPFEGERGLAGVLTLVLAGSGGRYREADRPWFEEISRRISAAVRLAEASRERDRALEKAKAERRKLHDLFAQVPAPIVITRGKPEEQVVEYANDAFLELFGLSSEIFGRRARDVFPDQVKPFEEARREVYGGDTFARDELPVEVPGEEGGTETRYFNAIIRPLREGGEEVTGMLSFGFEVTDLVKARRRAESLAEDLAEAREEAETANRAKDEFLAMLGHELRDPIAPIRTALELMALRPRRRFVEERAVIERQVSHLARLVDDLLDVSRITRGKIELRKERVSLGDVVKEATEMVSPLFEEREHVLRARVDEGVWVDGDPARLSQIVANLLSNAAKFTPKRGYVEISGTAEGGEAVLRVCDTGIGIDDELMPRLFDLFSQGPRTPARAEGGLGLGLAIVRSLTEMHGGRVSASSEGPGKGSEFTVRLPAAEPPDDDQAKEPEEEQAMEPDGRRILVVDDNRDAAEVLGEGLSIKGFEVEVAFDAPSALETARDFRPDVVLLDLGLPVMDGYEVARRMREQPENAQAHLVAVTGYGQEEDRRRTREAGFEAHVVKPVRLERLLEVVSSLAGARRDGEGG